MRKDLKKNKKGFTLVEIIVVLLIIGILLAITIPSIMGYVGKAKDAQLEAEARSGYVAAQTITARMVAQGKTEKDTKPTANPLSTAISGASISKELGETLGDDGKVTTSNTIQQASCSFDTTNGTDIVSCAFKTKGSGDKVIVFRTNPTGNQDPTEVKSLTEYTTGTPEAGTLK